MIEAMLFIGVLVVAFFIWWWLRPTTLDAHFEDNIIRKNIERPCTRCGRPVMVDAFTADPLCINCLDGKDA